MLKSNIIVRVDDGDVEKALQKLKRKSKKEGLTKDIKKHRFFEKPSDIRRKNLKKAKKKLKKKLKRERMRSRR